MVHRPAPARGEHEWQSDRCGRVDGAPESGGVGGDWLAGRHMGDDDVQSRKISRQTRLRTPRQQRP